MRPSEYRSIQNAIGAVIEIKVEAAASRGQPEATARDAAFKAAEFWLDQRGHDSRSALFQDLIQDVTQELVKRTYTRAWAERATGGYRF